ncbi:MAG: dockerin type I domain-containing protein [Gammaproteobacteria bacterium]
MKHHLTIVKSSLAAALLLFVGAGAAQAQTPTQMVYFAEPGSTTPLTTFQRTRGSEFSLDVVYDDDQSARSVVSFNVHWDDSEMTYGGVVENSIAVIEDTDPMKCLVSGTAPAGVGTAAGNTKVGGPDIFVTVNNANNAGDDSTANADGIATTDKTMTFTWAQICGDVFESDDAVKLFTVKFTWKDTSAETEIMLGLSQANGGDFVVSTFDGTNLPIGVQLFNLDVDGNSATNFNDLLMIIRYVTFPGVAGGIPDGVLVSNIAGVSTSDAAGIKTSISAGGDLLDVDASGAVNFNDLLMIIRYVTFPGVAGGIPDGVLVSNIAGVDTGDAADIKQRIGAITG